MMNVRKSVRIGGACAFVGDSILGPRQLVAVEGMQYLVFDYLAEMTLSGFSHARKDNPELGYATDFIDLTLREILPVCQSRRIKLVANAGGLNAAGCVRALEALQQQIGTRLKVAYVEGDDCMSEVARLRAAGTPDLYSGEPLPERVSSANVYLGALPVARALGMGADIVVTGRIVDSATTLGIFIHEFGLSASDHDALAMGSLAGHILECGTQASGGIHTDWRDVPDWENMGYPYIDCDGPDSFTVRKPAGTGGLISTGTVSEQILYEIGDPARYMLPDVTCDFTQVSVTPSGPDEVTVRGARGRAPSTTYKLSTSYLDGYRCVAQVPVFGIDAVDKARRNGQALLGRARAMLQLRGFPDFSKCAVSVIGAEDDYGAHASHFKLREAVTRVAVTHGSREALDLFSREARIPGVSFAPGTTTGSALNSNGRPAVEPLYRLHTALISKAELVPPVVVMGERRESVPVPHGQAQGGASERPEGFLQPSSSPLPSTPSRSVPLVRLAYGRSGDKGNTSNVAIIARRPEFLPVLKAALTPRAVKDHLRHLVKGRVACFDVPGLHALNFFLEDALDGGGTASLRIDPMGKGIAQQLLEFEIPLPADFNLSGT